MGDEGDLEDGQVEDLTKLYKTDPSIEHYVRLRREKPDARIEVGVIGGFDAMFYMREEFERYGIDPNLLGGILDADPEAVSEVSLRLMEKMIDARQMDGAGQTHLIRRGMAIPDRLIDWVISCSLDAMSWNDELEVPRDLIVLIRERLGGPKPQYEQERYVRHKKSSAEILAGQLKAKGITPTFRLLGQYLNVAPSTVKRWFAPGELEEASERWAALCDEKGQMLPLDRIGC